MKNVKKKKASMVKLSFITTPVISCIGILEHRNSNIFLNGVSRKSEVWAETEEKVDLVLDDLVMVMQDYDPKFEIKLLTPIGRNNVKSYHPSSPNWAYTQIPLNKIPVLKITDEIFNEIKRKLKEFESTPR